MKKIIIFEIVLLSLLGCSGSTSVTSKPSEDIKEKKTLAQCLDTQATPDNPNKVMDIIITNGCNYASGGFKIELKLYNYNNERIGWASDKIGSLEAGEKVHFKLEYPVEDYPLLGNGITKIVAFDYSELTGETH